MMDAFSVDLLYPKPGCQFRDGLFWVVISNEKGDVPLLELSLKIQDGFPEEPGPERTRPGKAKCILPELTRVKTVNRKDPVRLTGLG